MFALAPKLFPWKMGPFLMVKVAGSYDGFVERIEVAGERDVVRGVPSITLAR
jgi:hypothetical protein